MSEDPSEADRDTAGRIVDAKELLERFENAWLQSG